MSSLHSLSSHLVSLAILVDANMWSGTQKLLGCVRVYVCDPPVPGRSVHRIRARRVAVAEDASEPSPTTKTTAKLPLITNF
jgi:hypothetical protein